MCVCLTTGLVSRASRDSPYDTGAGANHGGFSCSMASRPYPDVKHSDLATPHPGDAAGWKSWLENLVDNVAWRLYIGGVTWLCNGAGTPPKPRYVDGSGLAAAAAMPTSQARAMSAMCAPPPGHARACGSAAALALHTRWVPGAVTVEREFLPVAVVDNACHVCATFFASDAPAAVRMRDTSCRSALGGRK